MVALGGGTMTHARQVGLGVAAGVVCAVAVIYGFGVEASAVNVGVVSMICVSLAVALVELFGDSTLDVRR